MTSEQAAYQELQAYTLAHPGTGFIHQNIVDAWAAQHADEHSKSIGVTFALMGLYLSLERGFTGQQVQRVHMLLGQRPHGWPSWELPDDRGDMTSIQVMEAPAGPERDAAIHKWCAAVWAAWQDSHRQVIALLEEQGIK